MSAPPLPNTPTTEEQMAALVAQMQAAANTSSTPRTAVKPRLFGGIVSDPKGNETPFTGKGRTITLPGGNNELVPATVWAQRPDSSDVRFYEKFENKLENGIGVEYSGDTAKDTTKLEDWRLILLKNTKNLGLDSIFTIEVDGTEMNVIEDYAPFHYELCEKIHKYRTDNDQYDYYELLNLEYAYRLIINSVSADVIKSLKKYRPKIDDNGFLLFAAIIAIYAPATEATARNHVTKFQNLDYNKYGEDVDAYLNDVKLNLDAVEQIQPDLVPDDAPGTIVWQLANSHVVPFTTKLLGKFPTTGQDTTSRLEMTASGVKKVTSTKFTWREVVTWASSEYSSLKTAGRWPPASAKPAESDESTQLKGMMAKMENKINNLTNQLKKSNNGGSSNSGGGSDSTNKGKSGKSKSDGKGRDSKPKKEITEGWLVCGSDDHWIKDCDKGHVPKLIPPEGEGPETVKTPTGTFDLCRTCKSWYKQGKKSHHTTDTHVSKSDQKGNSGEGEKKQSGNLAQLTTSAEHPDEGRTFED